MPRGNPPKKEEEKKENAVGQGRVSWSGGGVSARATLKQRSEGRSKPGRCSFRKQGGAVSQAKRAAGARALQRGGVWAVQEAGGQGSRSRVIEGVG